MIFSVTLPHEGKLLIREGQNIDFTTPLYEGQTQKEEKIPLASILKCSPHTIFQHLKKFAGDHINKGDVIAVSSGLFGSHRYTSPAEGTFKEIDHITGTITISIDSGEKNTEYSFFAGEISLIEKNVVTIKTKHGKKFTLKQSLNSFGGNWKSFKNITSITSEDVAGFIIITEKLAEYEETKLEALDAKGFVTAYELPQSTSLPTAIVKDIKNMEEIQSLTYPYCTIDKESTTMYLYE
ncbi:MAG: hypothetical protein Q7S61_00205 [bacterium]|nr:hypothetical protein [bacterium]